MAGLAAVDQVGESLIALLRRRHDLLAAQARLGPLPATLSIRQASLSQLATQPDPVEGCTLTCWRIAMADRVAQRPADPRSARDALGVELHYLLTSWSPMPAEEQSILSWAMLALSVNPVLDRSTMPADSGWGDDEIVQVMADDIGDDALFGLWRSLRKPLRLCATFRVRVVRIEHPHAASPVQHA